MALTKVQTEMAGTGSVLQVVSVSYATEAATTSASFVDTGLTLSITPKFATSKILVIVNQQFRAQNGAATDAGYGIKIVRNSTTIISRDEAGTANYYSKGSTGADFRLANSIVYLDSPATATSTTYKTQMSSYNSSTITAQKGSQPSTITLMEIAG